MEEINKWLLLIEPNYCTIYTHTHNFPSLYCWTFHSFSRKESRIEWRLLWFISFMAVNWWWQGSIWLNRRSSRCHDCLKHSHSHLNFSRADICVTDWAVLKQKTCLQELWFDLQGWFIKMNVLFKNQLFWFRIWKLLLISPLVSPQYENYA